MTTAAVLYGTRDIRIENRPMPVPRAGEVLLETRAVGICGSDVHYYTHGRIGDFVVREPLILGHETSGIVTAVGDGVPAELVGRLVALEPGIPDGSCALCRAGHYNLCPSVRFFGTPPVDGTLIGHLVHKAAFVFPVPASFTEEAAALIEPLSVAIWACRRARVRPGDEVLITGGGPIGLLCSAVARASGASQVIVSEPQPARAAQAVSFGADEAIDPQVTGMPVVDVLLECSGNERAATEGLLALRPGGRALLIGMSPSPLHPLPVAVIQSRELEVSGTFRYANTYPAAIALAARGSVDLDRLVSLRFGLADTDSALTANERDPASLKVIVAPQQ